MLRLNRLAVAVATLCLVVIGLPAAAFADWGDVTCEVDDPYCEIAAGTDETGDSSDPPSNGDGSGTSDPGEGTGSECDEADFLDLPVEEWPFECLIAEPQAVSIADLAATARDRLVMPTPELATSPADRQLVHLPVWLAVSESSWRQVSASASAGTVTVTATAAPSRIEWTLGDGTTVTCDGPGTLWQLGMDPAAPSPDCGHTYSRSSSAAQVSATVFWTVTWSSSTGSGGTFADLATTAAVTWEVAESRSVVVR
jgi:hypothetical protein